MPLTYRLDDLGWFEFERIIQALLKAHLGLGVEAWGGSGDLGREAYFEGQLRYPTTDLTGGRFVFQCKFVEGANAAGAEVDDLILNAVRKERTAIKKRLESGTWEVEPTHYCLFTNAPLAPPLRFLIKTALEEVMPKATILQHSGEDICAWLRLTPTLIRTCPQLLTIRDLNVLLTDIVNGATISRSEAAIDMAREQSKIFVSTGAYHRAWEKLHDHHFVVLEGPPEMGKSTIGRMIALAQLCNGWDAIEVRSPKEVLQNFSRERKQVFVADDFFGRTEYDPTMVSDWQAELSFILPKLNAEHWLVLTSRAHLLRIAKPNLDIAGQSERFPTLGEVIVNAGELNEGEKGRILYRHAKAAKLSDNQKVIVRQRARTIVENQHYTPERIRRFVEQVVPAFPPDATANDPTVARLTSEALDNPTQQMRVSFRSLPEAHKWLLWSMLDGGWVIKSSRDLKQRYERLCPPEVHRDYETVAIQLTQAFLRKDFLDGFRWVHPSWQDLAIDELSVNRFARERFLRHGERGDLLLAMSIGGGPSGERVLPLLTTDADWKAFSERAVELVRKEAITAQRLWSAFTTLIKRGPKTAETINAVTRLKQIFAIRILPVLAHELGRNSYHDAHGFFVYQEMCDALEQRLAVDLSAAWNECERDVNAWSERETALLDDDHPVAKAVAFMTSVKKHYPDQFEAAVARGQHARITQFIAERLERDARIARDPSDLDSDGLQNAHSSYGRLQESVRALLEEPATSDQQRAELEDLDEWLSQQKETTKANLTVEMDDDAHYRDSDDGGDNEDVDVDDLMKDL